MSHTHLSKVEMKGANLRIGAFLLTQRYSPARWIKTPLAGMRKTGVPVKSTVFCGDWFVKWLQEGSEREGEVKNMLAHAG